jgi:rhomboid protease GluP
MQPSPAAVAELGLDLKQSPALTELRLPSRLGVGNVIALGFLGAIVVLLWTGIAVAALSGPGGGVALLVVASLGPLALLYGLTRVRRGVKVSVTPDRLVVKRHWATGGESLELYLSQVRFDETQRAIVVAGGRRKMKIGTGLKPQERHAVVEFLTGVIAGHLDPGGGGRGRAALEPELTAQQGAIGHPGTGGANSDTGEQPDWDPVETRILALCQRFDAEHLDDAHISPNIPQPVLVAAEQSYLDLRDDEVLLAIVGVKMQGSPVAGCALTTRRIYWPGKRRNSLVSGPPRCHSLDYAALPENIQRQRIGSGIDLGQRRSITLNGTIPLRDALITFLGTVRSLARNETVDPKFSERERAHARWVWPRVAAANAEVQALQAEIRAYDRRTRVASRSVVTPIITMACAFVYLAMIATGSSPLTPTTRQLIEWGANFGPSVIFDNQVWRLFTAMFVHIGLVHIIMNMFCLVSAGPLVERFFGHLGFAVLYVLSGIGGSMASLWVHPALVSAGASGAIFGIFGGLVGFLAIRHRDVPPAVLKPMRGGATTFIAYNTIFSAFVPGIDMAAHLGGLAIGFVCGVLLTAVSSAHAREARGLVPVLRRSVVTVILVVVLAALGQKGVGVARARLMADPEMGPRLNSLLTAAPAFNAFFAAANPILLEFDRIAEATDEFLNEIEKGSTSAARITQTLERLKAETKALGDKVQTIPAQNDELRAIRGHLTSAHTHRFQMLNLIEQFVATGDERRVEGPNGLVSSAEAFAKDIEQVGSLRDAYIKAHNLRILPVNGSR